MKTAELLGLLAGLIVKKEKDRLRPRRSVGVLGCLAAAKATWLWRRSGIVWRALAVIPFMDAIASAAIYAIYWLYVSLRPQPEAVRRSLFKGVTYIRDPRRDPRPLVVHVVAVDLTAPGVRFLVTPSEPTGGRMMPARTCSEFIADFGAQVAINAGFFSPAWWNHWWDYYPRSGQPLDVYGLTASEGDIYAEAVGDYPTIHISCDNRVTFDAPSGEAYNALAGSQRLLVDGVDQGAMSVDTYLHELHPRTAVALDEKGETLLLVVVDGRQPNYSEGVTLSELAQIICEHGGHNALNLDGGGSSALAIAGKTGQPALLNSPVDGWIPGRERPVANHLGVFAGRLANTPK